MFRLQPIGEKQSDRRYKDIKLRNVEQIESVIPDDKEKIVFVYSSENDRMLNEAAIFDLAALRMQ